MSDKIYLTKEGLQRLRDELEKLRTVDRPGISKQIAEARDKGDLSENAEYSAAKEAQGLLEMKISRLESQLAKSRVIDESRIDTFTVQILNKVKIKNRSNNMVMEYQLVPVTEANLKEHKLAVNSPIARGLLGKVVGDVVDVNVPSGTVSYEVIDISI